MNAHRGREAAWVAAGFVVFLLAQVARAMMLARLLTPQALGTYFVFRGIAGVAGILIPAGLAQTGLRRVAAAGESTPAARAILRHVIRTTLAITPAVAVAMVLVMWLAGVSTQHALLTALLGTTMAWTTLLVHLARGVGRVTAAAKAERVGGSLLEVGALGVLLVGLGETSLTAALAVGVVSSLPPLLVLSVIVMGGSAPRSHGQFSLPAPEPVEGLIAESWPVTINALLWKVLAEVDLWIVAALAGADQAALYGVAVRVAVPLQLPQSIAIFALAGRISALHAAHRLDELERMLKRAARQALAVAAAGYLVMLVVGASGLALAFGEMYARAMPIVVVFGARQLFNAASGVPGTTLLMIGRSRVMLQLSIVSTLATTAAALVLVPRIGVLGAALASAGGTTLQNVLAVRAVKRLAGISVHAGPRRA